MLRWFLDSISRGSGSLIICRQPAVVKTKNVDVIADKELRCSYGKKLGGPAVRCHGAVDVLIMAKVWDTVFTIWSAVWHNPAKMRFALPNRWRLLPVEAENQLKISDRSQEHHITVKLMVTMYQSDHPSVSLSTGRPIVWLQRSWKCLLTSYCCAGVPQPARYTRARTTYCVKHELENEILTNVAVTVSLRRTNG